MLGYRQIGRIEIADGGLGTKHLICGNWSPWPGCVNGRDRPEEGSMRARNIGRLRYPGAALLNSHMVRMMRQSWRSSLPSR